MEESLSFFTAHLSVGIAKNKPNGSKEIALARAIAANDNVVFWRERLDDSLVFVAITSRYQLCEMSSAFRERLPFEALDDNLFDMHGEVGSVEAYASTSGLKASPDNQASKCDINKIL